MENDSGGSNKRPEKKICCYSVWGQVIIWHRDFIQGELAPEQGFLICSDGFRHVISTGEIAEGMRLPSSHHEDLMRKRLEGLTELCKQRGEKDNITSIWIQVCR